MGDASRGPFARNLRYAMGVRGYTQQGLAERVGVSHRTVNGWCRDTPPRPNAMWRLCAVLGFDEGWFNAEHGHGLDDASLSNAGRDELIRNANAAGLSARAIGRAIGLSHVRVQQIIHAGTPLERAA